jgi:hypothetical protein
VLLEVPGPDGHGPDKKQIDIAKRLREEARGKRAGKARRPRARSAGRRRGSSRAPSRSRRRSAG